MSSREDNPKPLILAIDSDPAIARALERDLGTRYGIDYRVEVFPSIQTLSHRLPELTNDSVALAVASLRLEGGSGLDALESVRQIHPEVMRMVLLSFGDTAGLTDVIEAASLGRMDSYTMKPWGSPDQWLHPALTDLLGRWVSRNRPTFELFRILAPRSSPEAYRLTDVLDRSLVPYRLVPAESEDGRALLSTHHLTRAELPAVLTRDGQVMVKPSTAAVVTSLGAQTRPKPTHYDVAIVGAGPAGLAAAVYGASEGLTTVLLEADTVGGQAGKSSLIRNYLGFPWGIPGAELALRAFQQTLLLGADTIIANAATGIHVDGDHRIVSLADGSEIITRSIVLATGVSYRLLGIPSVDALTGAGVFYGAVAGEAAAMKDKHVFVAGAGNAAAAAALQLAAYAAHVTILVRGSGLDASVAAYLASQIANTPSIEIRPNTDITGASGSVRLESLQLSDVTTGTTESVEAEALFVMIGSAPHTDWLGPAIERDAWGFILTGPDLSKSGQPLPSSQLSRAPLHLETSVPGIFAAGDVRHGALRRVTGAAGEGATAITMVRTYLKGSDQ